MVPDQNYGRKCIFKNLAKDKFKYEHWGKSDSWKRWYQISSWVIQEWYVGVRAILETDLVGLFISVA